MMKEVRKIEKLGRMEKNVRVEGTNVRHAFLAT